MKSINLPTRIPTQSMPAKSLTLAVMTACVALSQQANANQNRTLPVTELESIQFDDTVTIEELSKLNIEHRQYVAPAENATKTRATTKKAQVSAQNNFGQPTAKPFISQKAEELARREAEIARREAKLKAAEEAVARLKAQQAEEARRKAQAGVAVTEPTVTTPTITKPTIATPTPKPIQPTPTTTNTGAVTGEVVAGNSANDTSNDEVIKNIQNKDGKVYKTVNLTSYAKKVNSAVWTPNMKKNSAMTVKLQALLDWNHASPGPIDGGWGMNSVKALTNFQAMKGLPKTGKMNQATWNALTKNIKSTQPVLMSYKIRPSDTKYFYTQIPRGYEAKSKLKALNYQNIYEKIAEEYHMNVNYLKKLNKGKRFVTGETITVYNPGPALNARITKVVANKADRTLYAYNGKRLVATYPTTVGSSATPSPHGTFKIANRVKKPYYRATVGEGKDKQVYMLKPGPNSPVGIVWMGLSKPSYGIHGSPIPEGISRQASHGCIRLTNWDALEVRANIKHGATVVLE